VGSLCNRDVLRNAIQSGFVTCTYAVASACTNFLGFMTFEDFLVGFFRTFIISVVMKRSIILNCESGVVFPIIILATCP
jgi:hypothetical protein